MKEQTTRIVIPRTLSERVKLVARERGLSARAFVRTTLAEAVNDALRAKESPR